MKSKEPLSIIVESQSDKVAVKMIKELAQALEIENAKIRRVAPGHYNLYRA